MADDIKLILEEFVIKMKECLGSDIQSIVLYGSYARGDFNAQSDLDIMILVHSSDSDIKKYENVIENRLCDDCTIENVFNDNKNILELAKKYNVNYVLIDDKYEIDI